MKIMFCAAAAALFASQPALADEISDQPARAYFQATVNELANSDLLGTELAGTISLGYQWSPRWGLELGYKRDEQENFGTTDGAEFVLRGNQPLNQTWSIIGKAGVYRWQSKFPTVSPFDGLPFDIETDGTSAVFGLGLKAKLNRYAELIGEFERVNAGPLLNNRDDTQFGIGIRLNF